MYTASYNNGQWLIINVIDMPLEARGTHYRVKLNTSTDTVRRELALALLSDNELEGMRICT